jgi:hypothetical protein
LTSLNAYWPVDDVRKFPHPPIVSYSYCAIQQNNDNFETKVGKALISNNVKNIPSKEMSIANELNDPKELHARYPLLCEAVHDNVFVPSLLCPVPCLGQRMAREE